MLGARPHAQWRGDREVDYSGSPQSRTQALWCWPTATQLRPTRFWFLAIAANMSTIYSMDGAPGKSWKVNRDSIGLKLWVPQKGRASKPHRLKVNEEDPLQWAAELIDVAVDQLPQVLLDALRSSGEFLQSNCVPCVELYVFLPCAVLIHCAEVSKPHNCSHLPQVAPASMAIMFSPCRLMNQKQVRSFHSVYQMPRIHRATGPFMRATRAFFLV